MILRTYDVYFELFGKHLKVQIHAESEEHAKEIVKSRIRFDRVLQRKDSDYAKIANEFWNDIQDILKPKP